MVWKPVGDTYELLLVPPDAQGNTPFSATGINDAGDVVGKLVGAFVFPQGSFVWNESGGTTQLSNAVFPAIPVDVNEQRQIAGDSYRLDLDTLVLETIGSPTGTPYNYIGTDFLALNDAGECVGYSTVATGLWPYLATRYTPTALAGSSSTTPR